MSTDVPNIDTYMFLGKDAIRKLSETLRSLDEKLARTTGASSASDTLAVSPGHIGLDRWLKYGKSLEGLLLNIRNTASGSVTTDEMESLRDELNASFAEATFSAKYHTHALRLDAFFKKYVEGWEAIGEKYRDMVILAAITRKVEKECRVGLGASQSDSLSVVRSESPLWAEEIFGGDVEDA